MAFNPTPVPSSGGDIQANTYTTSAQQWSSVAALAGGGFVATWSSSGQDSSGFGVYAQRFDNAGNKLGGEFPLNTYTSGDQLDSAVTALSSGGFIVTWTSQGQDGSNAGVFARIFDANGNAVVNPVTNTTGEFQINATSTDIQEYASWTELADHSFVAVWQSFGQDGDNFGVFARRYDSTFHPIGGELALNTTTADEQLDVSVSALAGGGFVATWSSLNQDGDGRGVYAQRFDSTGAKVGGEFRANTYTTSDQRYSTVTGLADGSFVITWSSYGQDGDQWGIYGQRYTSTGATIGGEFHVSTATAGSQVYSSVTTLADGGFVVTWSSPDVSSTYGIFGQRYAANGTALGSEFRMNSITAGNQFQDSWAGRANVARLSSGDIVSVWGGLAPATEEVFGRVASIPEPFTTGNDTIDLNTIDLTQYANTTNALDGNDTVTLSNTQNLGVPFDAGAGDDTIIGSTGNDDITGGAGKDTLSGGAGNDTFRLIPTDIVAGESIDGGANTDTLRLGGSGTFQLDQITLASIEAMTFATTGTSNAVIASTELNSGLSISLAVTGSGNADQITVYGAAAFNTISLANWTFTSWSPAAGDLVTINGGTGADSLTGSSQDDLISGGAGNDTIDGGLGNDTLLGGDGNDVISDTGATTSIDAGAGDDTIILSGNFTSGSIDGGTGNDKLYANGGADVSHLTLANLEYLYTSATGGPSTVTATAAQLDGFIRIANNGISPTASVTLAVAATGTAGSPATTSVDLAAALNVVFADGGSAGGPRGANLTGALDNETITTGDGNDVVNAGDGNDIVNAGGGNDTINGGNGDDTLNGGAGNDTLDGGAGNDIINGGAGNDTINDTGGTTTTIDAGADDDTIILSQSFISGSIDGGTGTDSLVVTTATDLSHLTLSNLENLYTSGTGVIQTVTATAAQLDGFSLIARTSSSPQASVNLAVAATGAAGSPATTTIDIAAALNSGGGPRSVTLTGSLDNETFRTGNAADIIDGGIGIDTIDYSYLTNAINSITVALNGATNATVTVAGLANDTIRNIENVTGGAGNDTITGDSGANVLTGGAGNDTLVGGGGADRLYGGAGDDMLVVDAGTATFNGAVFDGGAGTDTLRLVSSSGGEFQLYKSMVASIEAVVFATSTATLLEVDWSQVGPGLSSTLAVTGSANTDYIVFTNNQLGPTLLDLSGWTFTGWGGAGPADFIEINGYVYDDILIGSSQNDSIDANDGNDIIDGGLGADAMYGGRGDDTYYVDNAGDQVFENAGEGTDTVLSTISYSIAGLPDVENITLLGSADINATGNTGANVITGNDGANLISGNGGGDTLIGGGGNDVFVFGHEFDVNGVIDGGAGFDEIRLTGNSGANTSFGGTTIASVEQLSFAKVGILGESARFSSLQVGHGGLAADLSVVGSSSRVFLSFTINDGDLNFDLSGFTFTNWTATNQILVTSGGTQSETITGTSQIDQVYAGGGDDTLIGGGGDDILRGEAGNDTLVGGLGNDLLDGGAGMDLADYASAVSSVTVTLDGTGGGTASGGADVGTDTLISIENVRTGAGNDSFDLADSVGRTLDGGGKTGFGPGSVNTATYAHSTSSVTLDVGAGAAPAAGHDRLVNIMNVTGSGFADTFNLTTSGDGGTGSGGRFLYGGGGADTATYTGAAAAISLIAGPSGANPPDYDRLIGFSTIIGSNGNDIFGMADAANQMINGGQGTDIVAYSGDYTGVFITNGISVTLGAGGTGTATDVGSATLQVGTDTLIGIENVTTDLGNDTFNMTDAGNNGIDGGGGVNTISYAAVTNDVSVVLNVQGNGTATDAGATSPQVGTDTLAHFRNVTTGSGNDTFHLTQSVGRTLDGGGGANAAIYDGSVGVNLDIGAGTSPAFGHDRLIGFESITGTGFADTFKLSVASLAAGDTIDGGAGTDTLVITIGAGETVDLTGVSIANIEAVTLIVPTTYTTDFALTKALLDDGVQTISWSRAGFDYAVTRDASGNTTVTLTDTGNQRSYATVANTYTPAGVELSSHVVYDDGSIADETFADGLPSHQVVVDNPLYPGANAFSSVVTDWSAGGVLAHRLTTYDNGDTLEQTYNPDGSRTDVRTDNSNSQLYTTATATFDANGLTTSGHDVYDNGRIGDFTYYADGHSHVDTFTGNASDPYTVADIVLDDAGKIIGRDYTWTDGWRHEISYDASGNATRVVNVDLGNHSAYASVETDYTAAGVLTTEILTYDSGTVTTQSYNADGSRTDATTYAAGGSIATSTASYTAAGLAISAHDVYANGQTGDFTYNANGTAQLDVIHGAASDPFSSNVTWFDGAGHPLYNAHFWKSGAEDLLGLHGGETIDAGALLNANTPTRVEIEGLGGNDTLSGAAGVANTFWFNDACLVGSDVVTNFHAGADVIDLRAVTGLGAFADLSITPANGGADATIAFGGATITLTGVTTSQLNAHNVLA